MNSLSKRVYQRIVGQFRCQSQHGSEQFVGSNRQVPDTPAGRVGALICYDIRFPEAARVLALKGADIIALPTNWPEGAESAKEMVGRLVGRVRGQQEDDVTVVVLRRLAQPRVSPRSQAGRRQSKLTNRSIV